MLSRYSKVCVWVGVLFYSCTCSLVIVDADSVELQVAVPMVGSCRVDAVFIADHLPELNK